MRRLLAALLLVVLAGCGASLRDRARQAVTVGGMAVAALDRETADAYTEAAREALEAATSEAEYTATMEPWNDLERYLRRATDGLYLADTAVQAWDELAQEHFLQGIRQCVEALSEVVHLMESLGMEVPIQVSAFMELADGLLDGDSE